MKNHLSANGIDTLFFRFKAITINDIKSEKARYGTVKTVVSAKFPNNGIKRVVIKGYPIKRLITCQLEIILLILYFLLLID